jgi:2-polyprenyl-6-methoxyphenol hydroxylase-like FAD-dependent oxidoreductase
MATVTKTDVIIVGAGPTGLSLAVQLIRYGIDFQIFDKKEGVTDLSKALGVHARTLEIYDQVGLAQTAVTDGEIVQKGALMHDGKISARLDFSEFGGQLSPFPFLLVFEQSKNERLLNEYIQHHGQSVQWQTELESLTQDPDGVKATIKTVTGETQTIEARYLVGCDGPSSPTRHLLDLEFEGSTYPRLFYVVDVEMEFQADEFTFYAALGQDSFVLMMPMEGDKHWRLIGNLPEYNEQVDRVATDGAEQEITFDEIETKVKNIVRRPLEITTVRWFSTYKVHTRRAETFSLDRCFLAGDAAHIHTPAGGQGMNTGIQDAYNLAWKIALVLKDDAGDALLASYNEERLANANHLLQTTDRAFEVAAGNQWYLRFLRDKILPSLASFVTQFSAAKEFLFPTVSQIGLNYHDSSLSEHQGDEDFAVKAGDRMPYFLVDGVNIYDLLCAPKFHLAIFADGTHNYQDLRLELELKYGNLIDINIIPLYPHVVEIFGVNLPFYLLLRPDNYIGFMTTEFSWSHLQDYFLRLSIKEK